MSGVRLTTADDVCAAAERTLVDHLPVVLQRLVDTEPEVDDQPEGFVSWSDLQRPSTWEQVPDEDALRTATFPAGAITVLDTVEIVRRNWTTHDVTWRLQVAMYDRGGGYAETARRARRWGALIRATLLDRPTIGGVASSLVWVEERYRLVPQPEKSRTLGGAGVGFDVTVRDVVDVTPPGPQVTAVRPQMSVRTQETP